MASTSFIALSSLIICAATSRAHDIPPSTTPSTSLDVFLKDLRRAEEADGGYYNPNELGGSMLTQVDNTYPAGQGEPVNIIISGDSDEEVLADNEDKGGILNYYLSLHFSGECLGQHAGSSQRVNLGDGKGYLNETAVIRWNYYEPQLGACTESINGGNHFRYWVQNGDDADSGAYFLAASYEMPISKGHDIEPNGYNLGRDYLVANITNTTIPTVNLTNTTDMSSYSGYTYSNGWTYYTDVKYLPGLLDNSSYNINHNWSVQTSETFAVDGLVALLKVSIHERPPGSSASSLSSTALIFLPLVALLLGALSLSI